MIVIIGYIIAYQLIYKKGYLEIEVPTGSIRTSLLAPSVFATNLTYCNNQNPGLYPYTELNCTYWDDPLVVFPIAQETAFTASTRVKVINQTSNCFFDSPNCTFQDISPETNMYLADVENFTILIDHTMYAPISGIQYNAEELEGYIQNQYGEDIQINQGITTVGIKGKPDIITLGQLLEFGGIDLDSQSPLNETHSIRYDGCVVFVFITYSNTYTYSTNNIKYVYSVKKVSDTVYDVPEPVILSSLQSRLIFKRHGIRLIFIQTGSIGSFRLEVLVLTLASSLGLLAVSTIIVDQMAIRILPQRKSYSSLKFQVTEKFEDAITIIGSKEKENDHVDDEKLFSQIDKL
ncbi:hypothetical protein DICPUDRAFT_90884 [Dictyostelium purpureum]|uniref:Purinergic receptor n=1 Tax=Dictyostelium purpureum TaxID=5786 RepID=F1A5G0_DICPU|nr:uncharacterized protein DICPUDRAFT_90884 [Dictyostelium purpureum]EGC28571.1 hypothetical protein DICPUDRAFT_90884 [Dictyostelium purpureum]|eukprot:XP_003294903.1 hypothetical protein DICPUDRAFT_90884 [Dictyostelium purpureum]